MSRRNVANRTTFNNIYSNYLEVQSTGVGFIVYSTDVNTPAFSVNPDTNQVTTAGDLVVEGNASFTTIDVTEYIGGIFNLATNNTADLLDIGMSGKYVESATTKYTGIARDTSDALKRFTFFKGITTPPVDNVDPLNDVNLASVRLDKIYMNDGTASLPSIAFDIDAGKDTGFYRAGENSIGITAGGEIIATITRDSGSASSYVLNTDCTFKLQKIDTVDDSILSNSISTGHFYFKSETANDKWMKFYSNTTASTPSYCGTTFTSATNHFFLTNIGSSLKIYGRTHSDLDTAAPDYRVANTEVFSISLSAMETKVPLIIPFGTLGALGFQFSSEATTGIYRPAPNSIGIVANGNNILNITDTEVTSSRSILEINGSASTPSFSFTNNTNMGLYRSGADILGIATGGVNRILVNNTQTIVATDFNFNKGLKKNVTTNASTTLTLSDIHSIVELSNTGVVTVTLPDLASNIGREYIIIKIATGTNAVNVTTAGADTIDNGLVTNIALVNQYDKVILIAGSTQWYTI